MGFLYLTNSLKGCRIATEKPTMSPFYLYLKLALFLGFKNHVYTISSRWGEHPTFLMWQYNAAEKIQKDLIGKGYFKCPSCLWATKTQDEHITKSEGYCYEQANGNPSVSWDQEQDGVLAYEKMPDRLRSRVE